MVTGLYQRLMLTTLIPACTLVLILSGYFAYAGQRSMEEQLFLHGQDIVRYMAPSSEYGLLSGNRQALQGLVQTAMEQREVRGAAIISLDGQISAISGRLSIDTISLQAPPNGPTKVAEGEDWVAFAAPVRQSQALEDPFFHNDNRTPTGESSVIGQVLLELDTTPLAIKQRALIFQGIMTLFPALMIFALLVARLAKTLVDPILRVSEAAQAMAEGQREIRVPETSRDEIGYLERGFNHMVEQINEAHQTLHQRIDEATAQLAYQARHDPLTGLINRREFETRLETTLQVVHSSGTPACVLFIDLDRFKKVNDVAGHMAGDELLRRISRQLQSRIRDTDTLARLGGDEFAVLLNGCREEDAQALANSLCQLVAGYHFAWEDKVFTIGASIGLVELDSSAQSILDVLGAGDAACYAAKAAGKNRVEIFRHDNAGTFKTRAVPGKTLLEEALAGNHLSFEQLPILPSGHSTVSQRLFELRGMLSGQGEEAPPIPLQHMMETAERSEIAHHFDQMLVQEAVRCLQAPEGNTIRLILLRLSGYSIRQPGFRVFLTDALGSLGVRCVRLCFLISEETAIHSPEVSSEFAQIVRKFGVQIGLDEFGGGIGSFKHIQTLQPRYARLASTLTRDIHLHRGSISIVRAIQEIAHDNEFETIASGISQDADRLCLEQIGIDFLQSAPVIS